VLWLLQTRNVFLQSYPRNRCHISESNHLCPSIFICLSYRSTSPRILNLYTAASPLPGFDPRQRQRIFPLTPASRPAVGPTQPPIHWVLGDSFPGGKSRPGRDADHSPPSSAEVKKDGIYLLSPQEPFMACSG
jgi:hypothetical protein